MRIFAFHLLNDYSGSPKVLMQLAKGWTAHGLEVHLVTSAGRKGFLSDIEGVRYHFFWYRFAANPFRRLLHLFWSQLLLFTQLFFVVKKSDIVYINTVLPFGAAFLGKLKGCRVIYHVHETTVRPPVFKKFLFATLKWAADDVVYVSRFLAEREPVAGVRRHVLHNTLEDQFLQKVQLKPAERQFPKNVLMICSLKAYKGIWELVQLAKDNPQNNFRLVVNASQRAIDDFFSGKTVPENLEIFDTQTDVHPFYRWADVLLNLSRPDGWVETFGLTVLEGMAYGLPAIVPPVGGVAELVEDEQNGFRVDARNSDLLNERLQQLGQNPELYQNMRSQALVRAQNFRESVFVQRSLAIIL